MTDIGYAYGYATVALAASEPDWDAEAHEVEELEALGIDPEYDPETAEQDRTPAPGEDPTVPYTSCPDWPHRYPCDYCGGGGCRHCSGTGEREDRSPCRH